jgi:DNA-binding HxlR family transcriptional regulator
MTTDTEHAAVATTTRWGAVVAVATAVVLAALDMTIVAVALPAISANVLTQRLTELESRGLVRRRKLPPPASVQVYEATEWGLEAGPVIRQLGRWAVRRSRLGFARHDPVAAIRAGRVRGPRSRAARAGVPVA